MGAREVAGRVEAVGAHEVRVAQAELRGLRVHHRDEASPRPPPTWTASAIGGVVRALDQRRLDQVADGDPLAGAAGRSSTRRRLRRPASTVTTSSSFACSSATSTVISFVMLAIGRRSRVARAQHLAGRGVLRRGRRARRRRRRRAGDAPRASSATDRGEDTSGASHGRGTLLHADALADRERGRVDAGFSRAAARPSCRAVGDASSVSPLCDHVELGVAGASSASAWRRSGRRLVAAVEVVRGTFVAAACSSSGVASVAERTSRTRPWPRAGTRPARRSARALLAAARATLPPRYQPETAQTSRRSRAASAPAAARQSSPPLRKA